MKEKTFATKFDLFKDSMSEIFVNEKILCQQLSFIQSRFENQPNQSLISLTNQSLYSPSSIPNQPSIVYIAVIAFNHKKGTIIEATYPEESSLLKDAFISSLNPNKSPQENLNEINNQLCAFCLPDGIHLIKEDREYFLIHNLSLTLYCASSYKQIQTSTSLVIEDDQENTRECIQKALCIVSTLPLFEYYSNKISATIDGYFTQKSLKDKSLLSLLFNQLITLTDSSIDVYQLSVSFNTLPVVQFCKERIFEVIKLLLLEKRIVVYAQIPGHVCGFIFALISLCNPGGTLFNYNNKKRKGFVDLGFPFKLFHRGQLFFPLFTLYDLNKIQKEDSFLIGTSNVLVLKSKELKYDCIINLDDETIDIAKWIDDKLIEISPKEKKLFAIIEKDLSLDNKKNQMKLSQAKWFINESDAQIENEKIDNWFISYFKHFLFDISLASELYRNGNYDLSTLTLNEIIESDLFKTKKKKTDQGKLERCIRKIFIKYNLFFIVEWIKTENFNQWFNSIDTNYLSMQSIYMKQVNPIRINYLNGDTYNGTLNEGLLNGIGTYYYYDLNQTYVGEWVNGKRCGQGNLSTNEALLYEGDWKDDEKNGYGSFITEEIKYSGYFQNNKMHGEGNWVHSIGDLYQGTFVNGLKCGLGKMHCKSGYNYEGFFKNDKYEGKGVLTDPKGIKYQGSFIKGVLTGEVTVILPNSKIAFVVFTNGVVLDNKASIINDDGTKTECEWPLNVD